MGEMGVRVGRRLCCPLLVAGMLVVSAGSSVGGEEVRRHAIEPAISCFPLGAAWLPGEDLLLVLDPREGGRLLKLRRAGSKATELKTLDDDRFPLARAMGLFDDLATPRLLVGGAREGEVFEISLAANLRVTETFAWGNVPLGPSTRLLKVRQVLRRENVVFITGALLQGDQVREGVFRMAPSSPQPLETVAEYAVHTGPLTALYQPGRLLAAAGTAVYFLDVGQQPPVVVELFPKRRKLAAFPPGFTRPPDPPPTLQGRDAAWAHTEMLEKAAIPLGLFGRGRDLLLLTRKPAGQGKTLWQLHRLEPERDRLVGSLTLPTAAPMVVVAPGEKRWGILELGPLGGVFERPLASWVELPAAVLDGSSTPSP